MGNVEVMSPFDYVENWDAGWQIIKGAQVLRPYHVMKAEVLDSLTLAAEERLQQQQPCSGDQYKQRSEMYQDCLRKAEVILQCVRSRADNGALSANHALTVLRLFHPPEQKVRNPSGSVKWSGRYIKQIVELARKVEDDPETLEPFVRQLVDSLPRRLVAAGVQSLSRKPYRTLLATVFDRCWNESAVWTEATFRD